MPPIEKKTRIVCFAPSDIAETIDLLALLQGLRRHFSSAHLAVACERDVAEVAKACAAIDEVVVLAHSRIPGVARWKNSRLLRKFDWALSGKAGIDQKLAALVRSTRAKIRIGFERQVERRSAFFTDPVAFPENPQDEHRVETLFRLLRPLGLIKPTNWSADQVRLRLPDSARQFAAEAIEQRPFIMGQGHVLIDLTGSPLLKFSESNVLALCKNLLAATPFAIALIAKPEDQRTVGEIGMVLAPNRIGVVDPLLPMEFAALAETSVFLVTIENESAHLAAAMDVPAVVVWPGGDFLRTHSRCSKHIFVHVNAGDKDVPTERVWQAMQAVLTAKKYDIEKQWTNLLQAAPEAEL